MTLYPGTSLFPATTAPFPEDGGESAPTASTGPVLSLGFYSATLSGTVNPNGLQTRYYWEYGFTSAYGSRTTDLIAGLGAIPMSVSRAVPISDPAANYHYRFVAYSLAGFGYGEDRTFSGRYSPADLSFIHESGKGQY